MLCDKLIGTQDRPLLMFCPEFVADAAALPPELALSCRGRPSPLIVRCSLVSSDG